MTHQWIKEVMEMTHQQIAEIKMTHGQIEGQEQMTEQWTEEEMEKTDECIELEQELTTECFGQKQEMTDEWMEQEMTMRSTFQMVIQNILHESMANLVLTAAATSPVLSFEEGQIKIDGTVQHTWNVAAAAGTKGIRTEPASGRPQRTEFSHWLRPKCILLSGHKKRLGLPTISATFFLHLVDQKYRQLN